MSEDEYDVIVVGGGFAGICCAADLVLRGVRPLLICESKEVGYLYRSVMMGENRGLMQFPTRQVGWADLHPDKVSGWWYGLVRELNIPVRLHPGFSGWSAALLETGEMFHAPVCASAVSMTETITRMFPLPDEACKDLERVLTTAFDLPYQELVQLHEMPLCDWLADQQASEYVTALLMRLAAAACETTINDAQYLSVFGLFGLLRTYIAGEGEVWVAEPDAREGLCIPIANEIERRGGAVLRGRKVAKVLIEEGKANGVIMPDGTVVRAPHIAMAYTSKRAGALLDPLPREIAETLAYQSRLDGLREYCILAVLDRPIGKEPKSWQMVIGPDGSNVLYTWSAGLIAPWAVETGKHLLVAEASYSDTEVAEMGGREAVFAKIRQLVEKVHPGFEASIVDIVTDDHVTFVDPWLAGPKLPRKSPSVEGLWYVGDGSVPCAGFSMEGSASTGILGARAIHKAIQEAIA